MRWTVVATVTIGAVIGFCSTANSQGRQRLSFPDDPRVTAEIDRGVQLSLDEAQELLKQKKYSAAVIRLQSVLDHPEDFFLDRDFKTKDSSLHRVKSLTLRVLAELPELGRKAYELHVGPIARDLLRHAQSTGDIDQLSVVASNYQMTSAGFDALRIMAGMALDHDEPLEAAMICETMLGHPRSTGSVKSTLLLQTAYAWHHAGEVKRSISAISELTRSDVSTTWKFGGKTLTTLKDLSKAGDWLVDNFGRPMKPAATVMTSWKLPRGGISGNESAASTYPISDVAWSTPVLKHSRLPVDDDLNRKWIEDCDEATHLIEKSMREGDRLTQLAAIPLVIGDTVVHRTLNEVTALSLKTGQLIWRTSIPDGMLLWLSQASPATNDGNNESSLLTFRGYLRLKLFRDQTSGSLTSDGRLVYSIEESDSQFATFMPRNQWRRLRAMVSDPTNKMVGYDLVGGRVAWEIGGPNGTPPIELSGIFFLGPPLPYDGRLYCLAESKSEIRLLSLINEAETVRLEWSQPLIATNRRMVGTLRRLAGSTPAIADGIAICSTSDGTVVAFDLVQRQLLWGYSYQSLSNRTLFDGGGEIYEEEEGRWLDSGPILTKGKVIITPRDSAELHCISLIDGLPIWTRPRERSLYVACVEDNQVVVVGRSQVIAYSLTDGLPVWTQPTEIPEPSGRGIRIRSQYLLPLSTGEIVTLDLVTGQIVARSRMSNDRSPGNLVAGTGVIVSRGLYEIDAYQSLAEIEHQIDDRLKANSNDPQALALRGELSLHRGQRDQAIDDLRRSLAGNPNPRIKRILAESLLDRLRLDPRQLLLSAEELDALTDDPRQKIEFLRLYAKSLNENGDPIKAVALLFRILANSQIPNEMIANGPDHFITLEQSIRSQLFLIDRDATPDEKKEIAKAFKIEFDAARSADDQHRRLKQFVKLATGHPAAESTLLRLTESTDEDLDESTRLRLLERMTNSKDESIAGAAIADLIARLLADDSPREAKLWITELDRKFAKVICRDGKTGKQLASEWLQRDDVRLSGAADVAWPLNLFEIEESNEGTGAITFPVEVVTQVGDFFRGWTFEVDVIEGQLIALSPSVREVWRIALPTFGNDLRIQPSQIHIHGRKLVFSSGMRMAVLECTRLEDAPRILFEQSLRPTSMLPFRNENPVIERRLLPTGKRFQLMNDDRGTAGFVVGINEDAVVYQLENRLSSVDIETGRPLWSRVGTLFAKSDGTVDDSAVFITDDNGAVFLRTIDGEVVLRRSGQREEMPLWFQAAYRLSKRTIQGDKLLFELRDFEHDQVVWKCQHVLGSEHAIVDRSELFILEPTGKLHVYDLMTGVNRFTTTLPTKRPAGSAGILSVHKYDDRYVIIAGVATKVTNDRLILPLDFSASREFGTPTVPAQTIDGHVTAIDQTNGHIRWTVPISEKAFDATQPPNLPILVLASKFYGRDLFSRNSQIAQVSVQIIDKRTGTTIFDKEGTMTPAGRRVQIFSKIDEGKLIVDLSAWRLDLKLLDKK